MNTTRIAISNKRLMAAGATLAAATVLAVATPELSAQRGAQRANQSTRAATNANSVETALRLAEHLELTPEQREQLEALRVDMLSKRAEHSAALMSLASEVRAGIRERGSVREQLAAAREDGRAGRQALVERYDGILTDEQKAELRRVTRRAAWRGDAMRGGGGVNRWRQGRGRPGIDRGRGLRGREPGHRGRGGERSRGWRRPGGPAD